jgi:hypothetical protein
MAIDEQLETTRRKALTGIGASLGIVASLSTPIQAQTPSWPDPEPEIHRAVGHVRS